MSTTIIKKDLLMAEVIRNLDKKYVLFPWANTEYEGQIQKQGDTVTVQTLPSVSWTTGGTAGASISDSAFTITGENLTADQVAQIRIDVKDISEKQSNLDLHAKIGERIANAKGNLFDAFIASFYSDSNIPSANKVNESSAVTLTKTNIYEEIEKMRVKLDENNVMDEAALFVSPAIASLIRQSALFDGFREGLEARQEAFVGRISGFKVYKTNNGPANRMIGFDKSAIFFVAQMTKMDVRQMATGFTDHIIGEIVYGGKVFAESGKRIVTNRYA